MGYPQPDPPGLTVLLLQGETPWLLGWLAFLLINGGLAWAWLRWRSRQPGWRWSGQPSHGGLPSASKAHAFHFRWGFLEIGVILLAVTAYCLPFLQMKDNQRLPGNEAEVFQSLDWTLVNALELHGTFPLWNPYLHTGLPYVADPMLHAYNPVVTIPVLTWGVRDGFRLAMWLSFLIGALGMWQLGYTLGLSRPVRMWMALMYAFAGQPTARFFQGQYLFVLGFAWIPWIIGGWWRLTEKARPAVLSATALATAMLFFSGNTYYSVYLIGAALVFGAVFLLSYQVKKPFVGLKVEKAKPFILLALLSLGLVAVQLFPQAEFWPRISKAMDLEGSHSLRQILLDFTSKDHERSDAYAVLPAREEFYAYIGPWAFIALVFLPFVKPSHKRRELVFFGLILLMVLVWVDLRHMPWYRLFVSTPYLLQFRHLLRVLVFGSFALIVLASLCLDRLFEILSEIFRVSRQSSRLLWIALPGYALLAGFSVMSVADLYRTNRPILNPQDVDASKAIAARWLREYDDSNYYVRPEPVNGWHAEMAAAGLRFMDAWYHFNDIHIVNHDPSSRHIQAKAHYQILLAGQQAPLEAAEQVYQTVEGWTIYRLVDNLPFVFSIRPENLDLNGGKPGEVTGSEVVPQASVSPSPNLVEVIASSDGDERLVVLFTHYPGWEVRVDGRRQPLQELDGYLSVAMQAGVHKYSFEFTPVSFTIGLMVSLASLAVALYLPVAPLLRERRLNWPSLWAKLKAFPGYLDRLAADRKKRVTRGRVVVEAVLRDGSLHPQDSLDFPPETKLRLSVEGEAGQAGGTGAAFRRWLWATADLLGSLDPRAISASGFFLAAIAIYLAVRLIGLENFPIYFFTDEAIQTNLAADFIRDNFKNASGEFFPTYFNNVYQFNLSVSVYLQVLPYLLFGQSVLVTRGAAVLVTLLAGIGVGLILRNGFKLPYWWCATMLLSITPAWFLHSRTAFETALMVSFYVTGVYFYMQYRLATSENRGIARNFYIALIFFALAFYSYSPGQAIVVITGLLLLLLDAGYHWKNRQIALRGLGLLVLLVLPYLRFQLNHPMALEDHLSNLASYWIQPLSFQEKVKLFFDEYLYGLGPGYWFIPNERDLPRHLMKGYGHLLRASLPFAILGLAITLRNLRQPAYRILLAIYLAAPVGSALVQITVTRTLVMVAPAVLFASLGLIAVLRWLEKRPLSQTMLSWVLFAVLAFANFAMLRDALVNGSTWYSDYGLGGMQYGARQLFGAVQDFLEENPGAKMVVSASWANGTDVLARFFMGEHLPVRLGSVYDFMDGKGDIDENLVLVMIPDEFSHARESGKFTDIQVIQILPYPDETPGFYFVRMRYVETIDEIFAQEAEARKQLRQGQVKIEGQPIAISYSMLDMGQIQDAFDGDLRSVTRTLEANPYVIELTFPQPRTIRGLSLVIGSTEIKLVIKLFAPGQTEPVVYSAELFGDLSQPQVTFDLPAPFLAEKVRIEIHDHRQTEPAHVHLWELIFH